MRRSRAARRRASASSRLTTTATSSSSASEPRRRSERGPAREPVDLQPERQPLAVLVARRIEPGELLDPLQPVGDGVAVGVERLRRRAELAVMVEIRGEGADEVGSVLLVVAGQRGDRLLVERLE